MQLWRHLNYKGTIGVLFLHSLIYFVLYLAFSFFGFIKGMPSNESLMQLDATWYKSIIDNGYAFNKDQQSNTAFFPLFPFLWKFLNLTAIQISLFNFLLTFIGFLLLQQSLNFDNKKLLLYLSIPSLFFCYVPYSEAVFFLSGAMIVYGLKKEHWLVYIGVFLACLSRSASLIFIPVIIFAGLYNYQFRKPNKKLWIETGSLIATSLVSLLVCQWIQYLYTGKFFLLFESQKHWNRAFVWPNLALTSWGGANLVWLDGLAFLVGALALIGCISFLIKKIIKAETQASSAYLFSIGYLALVTLVALFFTQAHDVMTTVYSLNRFVFASPFFFVFLNHHLEEQKEVDKIKIIGFVLTSIVVWLLFGVGKELIELTPYLLTSMKTQIYFAVIFIYSFLYVLLAQKKIMDTVFSGLYIFNLTIQIHLFSHFINGIWVG